MGSKFKLFYVLVRNKMPTFLPPLAPFQEISWLMAWINYLWGCYQALMGNYQVLQAHNAELQAEKAKMQTENAYLRLQIVTLRSQNVADVDRQKTEKHKRFLMKSAIKDAQKCAAVAQKFAAIAAIDQQQLHVVKKQLHDAEQRVTYAEEDAAYWQCRAEQAEQELDAREQRKEAKAAAKAAVLHELGNDPIWTSVSKVNCVKTQTRAVLEAQRKAAQKQAELVKLKSSIVNIVKWMPFDDVDQKTVTCPVIVVPSLSTLDAKIVDKGSAMNLIANMNGKFPTGHGATIQGTYECADVKAMYEGIFKLLELCGHELDK